MLKYFSFLFSILSFQKGKVKIDKKKRELRTAGTWRSERARGCGGIGVKIIQLAEVLLLWCLAEEEHENR
jgi:hypothetical protein